jgi:Tfp pilus assembly protein PilN
MIQFNLLPDIKLEYVKTQRTKRFLTLLSLAIGVVSIGVLAIALVFVDVVQKKSLSDENNDIARYSTRVKGVPNLNRILTVQNQLTTLTSLHDQKPVASRLFDYITQVTPAQVSLNQLNIDFTADTLTVGGSAPTLDAVSTYTDTLKATTYSSNGSGATHSFSSVVLSNFGRDQTGATFTITCSFDPTIFNTNDSIKLTVPQSTSTSQSNVFQGGN